MTKITTKVSHLEYGLESTDSILNKLREEVYHLTQKVEAITDGSMDKEELEKYLIQHGIPESDLFNSVDQHTIWIENTVVDSDCIRFCVLNGNNVYFSPMGLIGIYYRR